ncbi:hypothetical protein PHYSODRAFT_329457 [Phytophthora sojae]|uniref:START domain-containing protein n=1 Tax=Phytophthora sojae (strain P6497) TaxID=1094619 RepID=G4Z3G0_PHYSP|nr:hypothetical protein PHYSODRAFT_329457 [Phytophthora sojae]EGZ21523.1 hypothetical protein PHYSODRAFT_329457 [Phytophthora sojae]|eukprot:XP_009524240.1 hypothetical protein PHYSODRAFT_329457 [Phytophthora sojae]
MQVTFPLPATGVSDLRPPTQVRLKQTDRGGGYSSCKTRTKEGATMVLCLATNRFPTIHLTDEEQRYYDRVSNDLLKRTLHAYHEEQQPDLKRKQWAHVRRRDKMDVYKNIEGSSNPRVTLYVGKGLMRGTVEDIMDGLYCDTTEDLRKVKTLLSYKFIDGAVFQVSQRRSPDAPYRFAGIKWFAAKAPLGPLVADRDMLNYEVMGQVMDEHGNEFAFHSYQSIERSEWPADNMKNIKRAQTATCYLYRQHSPEYVECFFQGDFFARGKVMQKVSEYAMAGKWLAVSNAIQCAQAKKFSRLIETADVKRSLPSDVCDVCHARCKSRSGTTQCAGCMQVRNSVSTMQ